VASRPGGHRPRRDHFDCEPDNRHGQPSEGPERAARISTGNEAHHSSGITVRATAMVRCLADAGNTWYTGKLSVEGSRRICCFQFSAPLRCVGWPLNEKHRLRFLIAPLGIDETGTTSQSIVFRDMTFAPGPIDVKFRFDSYRASYRYVFYERERWKWSGGGTQPWSNDPRRSQSRTPHARIHRTSSPSSKTFLASTLHRRRSSSAVPVASARRP
jgi:hypothetical protein